MLLALSVIQELLWVLWVVEIQMHTFCYRLFERPYLQLVVVVQDLDKMQSASISNLGQI